MSVPDDPTFRTLTQPPVGESIADTEQQLTGKAIRVTIPATDASAHAPAKIDGYEIIGEIARGGMGVVLEAREIHLDREVAIKVMLANRRSTPAILRFVRESRIAARLGHPGIPPVHSMGMLADGTPYLAMKLIRGKTLAELLAGRESPLVDQSRYLRIFEQIAEAAGFAHSRGVIHRDLKPANIMVGEFGEVQVMDWGIAKVIGEAETTGETGGATAGHDDQTEAGMVIGTPAYIAPEQARGESVDARADVFALGAILSVILTGKTPFSHGTSSDEVIRWSAAGDLREAMRRLDESGASAELIALAKRCLSPEARERPGDAREVALAVASHRGDVERRLREEENRRAAAEARDIEQRKRRRVVLLAVSLIGLALAAGTVVSASQAIRARHAERETAEQLESTRLAQREADDARRHAEVRYKIAMDTFDQMIFAIQDKLASRPGTLDIRKELLAGARTGLRSLLGEAGRQGKPDHQLVNAHYQMGKIEALLGNQNEARSEFEAGHAMARQMTEIDPADLTALADLSAGLALLGEDALERKDPDRAGRFLVANHELVQRVLAAETSQGDWQKRLVLSLWRLGDLELLRGNKSNAHELFNQRLAVTGEWIRRNPAWQREHARSHSLLGKSHGYLEQYPKALAQYLEAGALLEKIAAAEPRDIIIQRDLSHNHIKIGNTHEDTNHPAEAVVEYEKAAAIQRKLAADDPLNFAAQIDLFKTYVNLGSNEASREEYARAGEWFRKARDVIKPWHESKELVGQLANALDTSNRQVAGAEFYAKAIDDLDFAMKQSLATVPKLLELRLRVWLRRRDIQAVVATAEAYERLAAGDSLHFFPAARAWSRAGVLADDASLRTRCAVQAVRLLKQAAMPKASLADRSDLAGAIRKDKGFAWLLDRDEGKEFLRSIDKK